MKKTNDTLATRLYAARMSRNLTQAQLAERAGVSRTNITHIESGRTPDPGASALLAIARVLEIDPRDLMPTE